MCANFEAIRKNRAFLLDLPEPDQLEFPKDIFPNSPSPLIFSNDVKIKQISVDFGMILKWAKEKIFGKYTYNAWTEMVAEKPSFREARHKSQFGLIHFETIFEPQYINGKSHSNELFQEGIQFKKCCVILICIENKAAYNLALLTNVESIERNEKLQLAVKGVKERFRLTTKMFNTRGIASSSLLKQRGKVLRLLENQALIY